MNYAWETGARGIRIDYEYEQGRLVKRGTSSYAYDNLGNCTNYNGTSVTWHRGKLLKKYGTTSYSYDNQGVRFRKERGDEIIKYYHDGGKLIDEVRQKGKEKTVIEYLYDIEGLMGMKIGRTEYHYLKDGKGNVRALLKAERLEYEDKLIARYDYDAWGNCVVKNGDGTINTDEEFIGNINPIRWKSQYYDTESGLYYIDGRYYSPVTKQYLSMENVESLIANAGSVYGLNGYLLTLTNPVNMVYNGYTIETNTELAYEAPELSAWQAFWGSTLGKAVAIGLVWLAAVVSMATGNIGGFLAAMGITGCSLALGGVISGYQSWRQGNGFWRGFDNYINYNWSQSFAITATLVVIDCGIRTVAAVVANASNKAKLAEAANRSKQAAIDRARELQNLPRKLRPRMVSAVVDVKTGKLYLGNSSFISDNINSVLLRQMPKVSLEQWAVANCAEFNAVNNALNAGARIHDLVVTTVRVSDLVLAPMCRNCVQSIKGVLLVVSG